MPKHKHQNDSSSKLGKYRCSCGDSEVMDPKCRQTEEKGFNSFIVPEWWREQRRSGVQVQSGITRWECWAVGCCEARRETLEKKGRRTRVKHSKSKNTIKLARLLKSLEEQRSRDTTACSHKYSGTEARVGGSLKACWLQMTLRCAHSASVQGGGGEKPLETGKHSSTQPTQEVDSGNVHKIKAKSPCSPQLYCMCVACCEPCAQGASTKYNTEKKFNKICPYTLLCH